MAFLIFSRRTWGHLATPVAVFVFTILLAGCPTNDDRSAAPVLLRFSKLDAFDPHRRSFECMHEEDANPPFTADAQTLFEQGMTATSHDLWPDDRDYTKAARLWVQASEQGHWKAQFNLAGLHLKGLGVPRNIERAIELTEDLMRRGVPAAWDNMGAYHMGGVGPLKQDANVAYAFWQRAADMGSMAAQAHLASKLNAGYDDPPSFWGNEKVARKMLECAFAQGSGAAAMELGLTWNRDAKNEAEYLDALRVLHDGVRFGSSDSANYLDSSFRHGDNLVGSRMDVARAQRYSVLGDALWRNPDLRFPSLDEVLPLPPAQLPQWNGDRQTLIDAAKALVVQPAARPMPSSGGTGRARPPLSHELLTEIRRVDVEAKSHISRTNYWQSRSYQQKGQA